jgi:hypothetical protein
MIREVSVYFEYTCLSFWAVLCAYYSRVIRFAAREIAETFVDD